MSYTLRFPDNFDNWNKSLKKIMKIPTYRDFFKETCRNKPLVVPNRAVTGISSTYESSRVYRRHVELANNGTPVYGWSVSCEEIYNNFPTATCILSRNSILKNSDGSHVNPVATNGHEYMIFLPDGEPDSGEIYDFTYNQRVCFTDQINGYSPYYHSMVDSGLVYFARGLLIDSNPSFETRRKYSDVAEFLDAVRYEDPTDDLEKWAYMSTNVTIQIE